MAGNQVSEKGMRWPSDTVNSATVEKSRPWHWTGVHKESPSGPAMALRVPSTRRTHGTIWP